MSIIKIKDLVFEYKKEDEELPIRALNNINLDIMEGSFTAIIGRNGSGKSTLAKNINALLLPSSGHVYVLGYDTLDQSNLWSIRQSAGMVFQNPDNQLVSAIVEDDVAFGPENLGVPSEEIRKRVDEALVAVDMYEHRKKAPHLLSGGQKQRIAIAGVIAMRPKCIILDEPTAMLDPKGRQSVLEVIHKLNKEEKITVLLITHFMDEAAQADRIVVMDEGEIKLDGTPKEVFENVAQIKSYGLTVPIAAEIAYYLREKGIDVPNDIITNEGLVEFINNLRGKNKAVTVTAGLDAPVAEKLSSKETETSTKSTDTSDAPAKIKIENITHIYSENMPYETLALDNVSLLVREGDFLGIIGHTGSGKSTLIQHINALLKPKTGRIFIGDAEITDKSTKLREIRKKVGLVFQYPEYQLFEETVYKDVAFGPINLGIVEGEIEGRVRKALELVGLDYEEVKDRSPFELSGGQKRKAAIAGVIAMEPDVLILDEPTAGLDPASHDEILKMLKKIHKTQKNIIILVSHNMGDMAKYTDRIIVMNSAKIVLDGSPREVYKEYKIIKDAGLSLPPVMSLINTLNQAGINLSGDVLSVEELNEEIFNYLKERN